MGEGTYTISLKPKQHGEHCISVFVAGESISSSHQFKFHFVEERISKEITIDDSRIEDFSADHYGFNLFESGTLAESGMFSWQTYQGRRHPKISKTSKKRSKQKKIKSKAEEEKASKKTGTVMAKSFVLDIEPWDNDVDINKVKRLVRSVEKDGLVWESSKLVSVAHGTNKLVITCMVENGETVKIRDLEEAIMAFDDYVQSAVVILSKKVLKQFLKQ